MRLTNWLQATNVVVTLVATWSFGMAPVNFKVLGNVAVIVVGIMIASFGEIKFDMFGFLGASIHEVWVGLWTNSVQSRLAASSSRRCVS